MNRDLLNSQSSLRGASLADKGFITLTHPPLREALLDIRLAEPLSESLVEKWKSFDKEGLGNPIVLKQGTAAIEISKDSPTKAVTKDVLIGVRFERKSGAEVVQFRTDGMTLSILRDYTTWNDIKLSSQIIWRGFLDTIGGSVKVSRIAARYINVIELSPGMDYDEYFTAAPRIPSELPQIVTGFFQRVVVPFSEVKIYAIITQVLETPPTGEIQTVLDIDVISEHNFDGHSDDIWDKFEQIRMVKNKIFFSAITNRTLELYK